MTKISLSTEACYNRKRKRAKGANPNVKPEMKNYDAVNPAATPYHYDAIQISNTIGATGKPSNGHSSWFPILLNKPLAGTSGSEVVGQSYLLKYFRFKGYIEVLKYPFFKMRYRLKLIRTVNLNLQSFDDYLALYRNTESNRGDANSAYASYRHNFFKMVKNVTTSNSAQITVLMSGVLPACDVRRIRTLTAGSTSSYSTGIENVMNPYGGCETIPIDIKVKVNDRVDPSVRYFIVLENDFPISYTYRSNPSETTNDPLLTDLAWANAPFYFNFFIQGYFTDD